MGWLRVFIGVQTTMYQRHVVINVKVQWINVLATDTADAIVEFQNN